MTSSNRRFRAVVLSFAALAAFAVPAPLFAQGSSCPAGAPAEDPHINSSLLPTLKQTVNAAWPTAATAKGAIDPLEFDSGPQTSACPPNGNNLCFEGTGLVNCLHTTSDFQISSLVGLSKLTYSQIDTTAFNLKDVAQHTQGGPDAGKITDGVFAPEGTSWNHPSYAVVVTTGVSDAQFAAALAQSALTIDLGAPIVICGNSTCGPTVQADRHPFRIDYSQDGVSWVAYSQVPEVSGSGLITRKPSQIAPTNPAIPSFTARYVRLTGLTQDSDHNYSISEVQLKDPNGTIISIDTRAIGPRPYQIADGLVAPEGSSFDDPTYAAVLRSVGAPHALVIDLGGKVNLCGSSACGPTVQADRHPFQIEYSVDGMNWVPYSQVPGVSGSGLITRTPSQIAPTNPPIPAFTAQFVRLYGLPDDDDNYSISEVQLRNTSNVVVSTGKLTYGPEALATDGEVAPEGADWNDPQYADILSPCMTASTSTCPQVPSTTTKGQTASLLIDLTASFPISQVTVQADRHQFQIDYSDDLKSWNALWTVPSDEGGSGLITRNRIFTSPLPESRYLRVYGTAGDDDNYSVSSVQVLTATANTPCAYNTGANAGQDFSCSYDGSLGAQYQLAQGGQPITFTVDSASAHLRCNDPGISGEDSTPSKTLIPAGTTCSAILSTTGSDGGNFCSGICTAGQPASVLSQAGLDGGKSVFEVTSVACQDTNGNSVTLDSDVQNGLEQVVAGGSSSAAAQLFNGLVVTPLAQLGERPMVPSGICTASIETPPTNAQLRGSASHVGTASEAGQVSLRGTVSAPGTPPLHTLALALQRVLHEPGGVEELVRTVGTGVPAVPLTLLPQQGSDANRAVYATAPGVKPSFRAHVTKAPQGQLEFALDVHSAHMPTLPTCIEGPSPSVMLGTDFSLGTNGGSPIEVHALQDWQCEGKHRLTTP